ncbi:hypothetical protein [Pseudomonas nitroreducens]|uniref:hypothetical protein n=1 Tax=Pseudomonas nitroreducens TaxID=46680 RepID=UPI00209EAA23|nr:hypothetical protein [Pseudomonas nitroreducens]MCP1621511.1 tetratricopeptide (TPR) repeat protein [Pseudomonas nitroreducens]
MARKAETNGIADTLRRLFGHDADRSLVSKLADEPPLQAHRVDPKGNSLTLKRSDACDNLIKNLVALDSVFNSRSFCGRLAKGEVADGELRREIAHAQARLQQKLRAYAYWFDRLESLEALLQDRPSLETFALQDRLPLSTASAAEQPGAPYALRAVQLLESVEEQGRGATVDAEQLSEKAWALHRLGLQAQAHQAARRAVAINPQHSEAWMLLALGCLEQKRGGEQARWRYQQAREWADPGSSHEQWAEEMRDEAEGRIANALHQHRSVIFPALRYWPFKLEHKARQYRHRDQYEVVRNWCIDWLFTLLRPHSAPLSSDVDVQRAYAANGMGPEFVWSEASRWYQRLGGRGGKSHGLSELELEVAAMLHHEWADLVGRSMGFSFFQRLLLDPQRHLIALKLLHIGYVLGFGGYERLRDRVLDDLQYWTSTEILHVLNDRALLQVLTTHCSTAGMQELGNRFAQLAGIVDVEQRAHSSRLRGNLWRQRYHHAFVRGEYACCREVAVAAQQYLMQSPDAPAPVDLSCEEAQQNVLSLKHWKYLELRAAVEMPPGAESAVSLLSVDEPIVYFADERSYLIEEFGGDEFIDESFWVAPYGDSIISTGRWRKAVCALAEDKVLQGSVIKQIEELTGMLRQLEDAALLV